MKLNCSTSREKYTTDVLTVRFRDKRKGRLLNLEVLQAHSVVFVFLCSGKIGPC